jgi:DNA modification methylase
MSELFRKPLAQHKPTAWLSSETSISGKTAIAQIRARPSHRPFTRSQTGFPSTILRFETDELDVHPTAKPLALMQWLIRSYGNIGETVLDCTMSSGTTGVAAALES